LFSLVKATKASNYGSNIYNSFKGVEELKKKASSDRNKEGKQHKTKVRKVLTEK